MRIPASIVYRQLEKQYSVKSICENAHRMVRGVFFASQALRQENYIYIMTDEDYLPAFYHMSNACLLLLSDCAPHNVNPTNDILLLPSDTDREKLLNDIAVIFQDYYDWAERVELCPDSYDGIRAMMDLTHEHLKAPLILTDSNLQFLYYTRDFAQSGYLDAGNHMLPSEDTLRLLAKDEDYATLSVRREVFRFPERGDHEVSLCYNLFAANGATQGRLMLLRKSGDYTGDDAFILEYLGYRIARILRTHVIQAFPMDGYRRFRQMLTDKVSDKPVAESIVTDLLDQMGWSKGNGFAMIALRNIHAGEEIIARERLRNQAERTFPAAFAVDRGKAMFLIMPGTTDTGEQAREALHGLCEPYGVAAGIGPVMESIDQCARCADICEALIEIGLNTDPLSIVADYTDFMLEYLMRYDTHGQPGELLCHPAVRAFKRHDDADGSAYVKTLRAFLHLNQSPTAVARELFIHRSTLLERLDRMQVIAGGYDWKDWRTKMCMMLSLELINKHNTAIFPDTHYLISNSEH